MKLNLELRCRRRRVAPIRSAASFRGVFITEFLSMRFNLRREGFTPVELLAVVAAVGFLLDLLLSTAQGTG